MQQRHGTRAPTRTQAWAAAAQRDVLTAPSILLTFFGIALNWIRGPASSLLSWSRGACYCRDTAGTQYRRDTVPEDNSTAVPNVVSSHPPPPLRPQERAGEELQPKP